MLRLFVAIPFPDDVRMALGGLCAGLPGARWVAVDHIHLTLRFIGEVDGGVAEDIHQALSEIRSQAFDMVVAGIGCFETRGKVRTLWAGIEKQALLFRLQDKIESAIVRAGCPPERRKFKAHVTLARFKNGAGGRIGRFVEAHDRFRAGPFRVSEFTLFRSHLGNQGPHYEVLADYPLEG